MCGITGAVWRTREFELQSATLDRMTDILRHRGPDGRGTYAWQNEDGAGVALGHRRLSIIDVAGGKQPLSNEDGTIWITFNGEVYNYRELKAELETKGHRFRTNCDTETIVHLYEEMGVDCLQRLRGMFAFAIWDQRLQRMFIARDRMGQKPLVYHHTPGRLLIASEIKSLLLAPRVPREVDLCALNEYLTYSYVPSPRTMYLGIKKLPPAHFAIYDGDQLTVQQYWHPDLQSVSELPLLELQRQLIDRLSDAVKLRLRSDVTLGAFLSGGIDSTTIVGLMQRYLETPAKTYTMGFPISDFDETQPASIAAKHLGTDHFQQTVQIDSISALPRLVWHFDEPFADSSAIPTYYLSQMTREHVKVALTGDGGDELFAGYPRYRTINSLRLFDMLPPALQHLVTNRAWDFLPSRREDSFARRLRFRMQILRQPADRRYVNWISLFSTEQRDALYTSHMREQLGDHDAAIPVLRAAQLSTRHEPGARAMHTDLLTYLPGDLLAKVDITSMAHGLECRSPFLDHHVVELATTIPFRHLVERGKTKPMLAGTFSELIPAQLQQRKKMGFRVPLDTWFGEDLGKAVRLLLLEPRSIDRGYFDPDSIKRLVQEHMSGYWRHGERLWGLLVLEVWHRTFIDPTDIAMQPLPASFLLPAGA